jgi:hypothetical protein
MQRCSDHSTDRGDRVGIARAVAAVAAGVAMVGALHVGAADASSGHSVTGTVLVPRAEAASCAGADPQGQRVVIRNGEDVVIGKAKVGVGKATQRSRAGVEADFCSYPFKTSLQTTRFSALDIAVGGAASVSVPRRDVVGNRWHIAISLPAAAPSILRTPSPTTTTEDQNGAAQVLIAATQWCQQHQGLVTASTVGALAIEPAGACIFSYSASGPANPVPNAELDSALTYPFKATDIDGGPTGVGGTGLAFCTNPANVAALHAAAQSDPVPLAQMQNLAGLMHSTIAELVCARSQLSNRGG